MYGAIQKLDEKLESLQAKVVHIEPVQLTTELFQKVNLLGLVLEALKPYH